MLIVTVEIAPGGLELRKHVIGQLWISNISDLARVSDYWVDAFEAANPLSGTRPRVAGFRINRHARDQSVWVLIARTLADMEMADFVEL